MKKVLLLIIILFFTGCQQKIGGDLSVIEESKINDELLLKAESEKIFYSKNIIEEGKIIKEYWYTTDRKVATGTIKINGKTYKEDVNSRTYRTQVFTNGEKEAGVFYSGAQFAKVNNKWVEVDSSTTTIDAFDKQFTPQLILGASGDPIYPPSDDGTDDAFIYTNDSNWDTAHDALTGTIITAGTNNGKAYARDVSGTYYISRTFFNFDTSAIGSGSTVTSASFYVMPKIDNFSSANVRKNNVYQSTHSDPIIAGDFDLAGTTALTDADIDCNDEAVDTYTEYSFNSSGLSYIDKTGITPIVHRNADYDVADTAPSDSVYNDYYRAGNTGTSKDPKLVIEWTAGDTSDPCSPTAGSDYYQTQDCTYTSDVYHDSRWIMKGGSPILKLNGRLIIKQ